MRSIIKILILALTILIFCAWSFSEIFPRKKPTAKKPNAIWEFYKKVTKEYCPEANYILTHVSKGDIYAAYGGHGSEEELVHNLITVVHEACHGFNWDIGQQGNVNGVYFINPEKTIAVKKEKVFNSIELNNIVPDSIQKKIGRYKTYIGVKELFITSQINGIYGLMDELTAYYHGSLAGFELKPWYEKKYGYVVTEPWIGYYLQNIGSSVTAFYEFRLFMAWYLDRSSKKYPSQYKQILANTKLREAFTLIYDHFEKLALQYETEVYNIEKIFKEKGFNVSVEKKYFRIYDNGGGSKGTGHFLEEIAWLKTLYTPQLETILKEFRN